MSILVLLAVALLPAIFLWYSVARILVLPIIAHGGYDAIIFDGMFYPYVDR